MEVPLAETPPGRTTIPWFRQLMRARGIHGPLSVCAAPSKVARVRNSVVVGERGQSETSRSVYVCVVVTEVNGVVLPSESLAQGGVDASLKRIFRSGVDI